MGATPDGVDVLSSNRDGDDAAIPEADMPVQSQTTMIPSNLSIPTSAVLNDDNAFQIFPEALLQQSKATWCGNSSRRSPPAIPIRK